MQITRSTTLIVPSTATAAFTAGDNRDRQASPDHQTFRDAHAHALHAHQMREDPPAGPRPQLTPATPDPAVPGERGAIIDGIQRHLLVRVTPGALGAISRVTRGSGPAQVELPGQVLDLQF